MKQWPLEVLSLTRSEIDEAVKDPYWQCIRRGLKGISTEEKLNILHQYRTDTILRSQFLDRSEVERMGQIQVDNYINALLRGGQLVKDDSNNITVQR